MTCRHCCGADQFFDIKSARKELRSYRKKGSGGATKKIIELISQYELKDSTLLDIGGGVGAIQWHFLKNGASETTDVDASGGYIEVASAFGTDNNWQDRTKYLHGDFNDLYGEVSEHDFVTLDKVICCYPDYEVLLGNAISKSNKVIALSFPIGGIISRFLSEIAAIYMKVTNNPFRTYIHPPGQVHQFIESKGFRLVGGTIAFPWHVKMYERISGVG